MSALGAAIFPHPPVILLEVGRGREKEIQATVDAFSAVAKQMAEWKLNVLILASPHTISYADYLHISPCKGADGDMSAFGAPQVRLQADYDEELRTELIRQVEGAGLAAGTLGERDPTLDHGVCIPLYFLRQAGVNCPSCGLDYPAFSHLPEKRGEN